jgi:hypothetical protein
MTTSSYPTPPEPYRTDGQLTWAQLCNYDQEVYEWLVAQGLPATGRDIAEAEAAIEWLEAVRKAQP